MVKVQPNPTEQNKPKTTLKTDLKANMRTNVRTYVKTGTNPNPNPNPKNPKLNPNPNPKLNPKLNSKLNPKLNPKLKAKPKPKSKPKSKHKSKPKSKHKSKHKSKPKSQYKLRFRNIRSDIHNELLKRAAAHIEKKHPAKVDITPITEHLGISNLQCIYCDVDVKLLNMDEMIPVTKGGRVSRANRVPCCGNCNSSKGNRDGYDFVMWLMKRDRIKSERAVEIAEYIEKHKTHLRFGPGTGMEDFETCAAFIHAQSEKLLGEFNRFIDALLPMPRVP